MLTASERQRMVNPRKAYPIDPGLIPIYERSGRGHLGHALETAVLIELLRRGCEVHYVRTRQGNETDFHALFPSGDTALIQVCADASDPATFQREIRSLQEARAIHPDAAPVLLLLDPLTPGTTVPGDIQVLPALGWFLQEVVR